MERLTKREILKTSNNEEFVGCNIEVGQMNRCPDCNDSCMYGRCKWQGKANRKLKEYEDMEEQELLLKLPCKVGDKVYRINKGARNPIIPLVVTEIRYKALRSGKVAVKLMCSDDVMTKTNGCLVYYLEEIGKKIWLTEAEAEKALEDMRKKKG